jgi:UPF0148 protein
MSNQLTKKAVEMLLKGATLLGQPCPYCSGVRVMKEGHALCISCGREPEKKEIPEYKQQIVETELEDTLRKKLVELSKELKEETNYETQQQILRSMNCIIETIDKLRNKQ